MKGRNFPLNVNRNKMKSPPIREVLPKVSKTRLFWMRSNCPVQLLDKDQPVHMIIRGDQNKYIPFYKTIESLAAHYSQEIQALQPEGPYILSGYCYWGIVALEIAQHLKRQEQEIKIMMETIRNSFHEDFDNNQSVIDLLPKYKQDILKGKISSYKAASDLLNIYYENLNR